MTKMYGYEANVVGGKLIYFYLSNYFIRKQVLAVLVVSVAGWVKQGLYLYFQFLHKTCRERLM